MSQEQLAFQLADEPVAKIEVARFVNLWKRKPVDQSVDFKYRPSEAPNEPDDHYWECLLIYELTRQDLNRALDDTDICNLKRVLIEKLSAKSGGVMSERSWSYRMAFKVWESCGKTWLTCWLE
jgi:hypothetical protein